MSKGHICLWVTVYRVVLELVYAFVVSPMYSYYGLVWRPNLLSLVVSYFAFAGLLVCMPLDRTRPSHQLSLLFFVTTVVPVLSLSWQADLSIIYALLVSVCCGLLFAVIRCVRLFRIPFIRLTAKSLDVTAHLVFPTTVLLLVAYSVFHGGVDVRALDLSKVYEIRREADHVGAWAYLYNWIGKLLVPFCMVMFMVERRRVLLAVTCLLQVYLYLCTGNKTTLFSIGLLIWCTHLMRTSNWETGLPKFYVVTTIASVGFYTITSYLMAIALFPVRQLIIPAFVSFTHYEFFSANEKLYFSEGIFGRIFGRESPYSIPSTYLVSDGGSNWNTGFLADAYDNAGVPLMLGYTLLLAAILLFIDSISRVSSCRYRYTACLVYPIIILNDGALLTTLLTWGLGPLLVLLYVHASVEHTTVRYCSDESYREREIQQESLG